MSEKRISLSEKRIFSFEKRIFILPVACRTCSPGHSPGEGWSDGLEALSLPMGKEITETIVVTRPGGNFDRSGFIVTIRASNE